MLRKVLSGLIEGVIGSYVEDVNSEKLSIGLLNGNLSLSQLQLKRDTLHRLFDIPLVLEKGTVGRISVRIPYTHLWSQPWQLCIEDVELIAYPSAQDINDLSESTLTGSSDVTSAGKGFANDTRYDTEPSAPSASAPSNATSSATPNLDPKVYLAEMEEKWWQTVHSTGVNDATALAAVVAMNPNADTSSWYWSYLASFGYGIVRSIQIEIHNVHLRVKMKTENSADSDLPDLFIYPDVGIFTVSLDHLTVKTADSSEDNHAEYKLIQIDNLRITWCGSSPNSLYALKTEDDTTLSVQKPVLYVLSPSCLTGHLCRRRTQSSLLRAPAPMQSRLMQIEFNASLGDLKLQLSREFCKATVQLSEFATREHQLMERFRRRPKCPIFGNITKWWQYAAGEIRPQLRPFFHSTLRAISLATLAAEAKSNVLYVKAYTTYLVRGLTKAKSSSTDAADLTDSSFLEAVTSDQSVMQKDNENDVFRRKADEDWPVGRIATLRLVAMRQAASKLHRFIRPHHRRIADVSLTSDSPVKDIPPINTEAKQPTLSPSSSSSTMSWYAWWRYSSLLGIRSLWYGPESEVSQSNEAAELPSSSSGSPTDSRPTVKDAVFELLDELAVSSDKWDIPSPANGGSSETDLVAFSLVCRVDGFTVRLAEDLADLSTQDHTHPAFLSVSGQRMMFTLDAEPCHRALRFAANVESFTVRDERHQLDKSPTGDAHHSSARPTFPFVIFPRITSPKTITGPPSSGSQLPIEAGGKPAANGLFWLIYDVLPPGAEFDYSLEIKTDPLYVVYQPELIRSVSAFVQAVVSVVSPTLESSARQQYEVIKERTQANIRAMLDETGVHSVQREFTSKPLSTRKPSRRWRLRLDISAPRLLLPDRLIDYDIDPLSGVRQSHFPLIGLLCDFGHMKVNNWPERDGNEESLLKNTLVSTDNAYSRSDQRDDDELFLTPCGTPTSLSDVDDECDDLRTVDEVNRNQFAPNTSVQLKAALYESYTIHLENLHVLVGELNTLENLGLWTNPVEERAEVLDVQDALPEPTREAVTPDLFKFSRTNSRLMSQLCLVDRFNLRLFVSRRITPSYELIRFNCLASQNEIANYPPSLWFTVEQERCVLQLSDVKIDKLLKCLNAQDGDARGTVEPGNDRPDTRQAPIARPSLRRSASCRHSEFSAPKSANIHPSSNLNFSSQKKRLIATFNVKELIVQLENKGYPVAECRLENAGGTWIRLAGQGAGYQGRISVGGFSIADAMANLGGDYDLVVASHKRIRLNSVGHLEVLSSEQKPSSPLNDPIFPRLRSCSKPTNDLHPPDGHAAPLLHFNEQATGSDLLRIYFDWMPSVEDTTVQSPGVHYRQPTGIRTLRIHLDRLDVVFNPNTFREISDCLQYLSPLMRPSSGVSKSSSRLDEQPSSRTRDVHPPSIITNHFELTLDQLCVLIIRVVCLSSLTCTQADMRSDGVDKVQRADRVVMATLNGLQWLSESAHSRSNSFRLVGLQLLDLMHSVECKHPYLLTFSNLASPRHSSANGPVSVELHFSWEPFLKRIENQSEQWHLEINGTFIEPTYVHSDETIAELIGWVHSLLIQTDPEVENHGTISHTHSLWPDFLSRANFHLSIRDPIVVFPMGDDLPRSSSHAVIAHFREIFVSTVCCAPRSGNPRIHIGLQSAELNTVDLDRFQPPTSVMKTHSVYRYATLWSLESDQKIIDSIISPTSVSIWLSFAFDVDTQLPQWLSSLSALSPMCLISKCEFSTHTLESNDRLETTLEPSAVPWSLIEIDVSDLLQIRLTSRVCNQLSRVANSLVTRFSQLTSHQSDGIPTNSDRIKREEMEIDSSEISNSPSVGLRVHLTALILDMMADLDMYPVPLSSLQLRDIILQVAHSRGSKTSGDLTVSSARLLDQLPPEHDKLQRIPATPSALLSVGSGIGLTTTEASSAIRRTNSCPNLPGGTGGDSSEQYHHQSPFLNSITLRLRGVSLDQLSESDRCIRDCRRIFETTDNVAARVQFVLLDREQSADLPEPFSKIRQFVLLDCGQLTCRLIPQCWVLLLDFVKFIKFTSAPADPMDSAPVQSTHTDASACGDSSLIFLMCVGVFQLTLVNCSSRTFDRESVTPCDLAELHACSLKLRVLNYLDQIANHLVDDRQFTPDNFKGPYYSVLCEVNNLIINAKPIQEAMLYEQRLFPRSPESYTAPSMSFQFICSRFRGREFPDEYDAYLWLRLEPTVYTHTQSFLTDVIDSLNAFLQNQDLISRARQSTEGLKVLTSAPLPFRLLLDVVAHEPRMIVPVSACSRDCMVASMDRLSIINSIRRSTDRERTCDNQQYVFQIPNCIRHSQWSDSAFTCWLCDHYSPTDGKDTSKPPTVASTSSATDRNHDIPAGSVDNHEKSETEDWCLLDCIQLNFSNATLYHAERFAALSEVQPEFHAFRDAADRCLQSRNYLVHPVRRPDGVHVTLFNPVTSVCFQLERNLSNYRSHHAPDWRLVAPLDGIHVNLTRYIYQVIRGLLTYNFGGGGDTAAQLPNREAVSVHRLFNRSKMPFTFTHQPAYYPANAAIQTSVTGIPWIVASFESPLQNMAFTFFPETEMNSVREPHTEFRLTRGSFSHVQLSNQCSRTELLSCDLQMFTSQLLTALQSMASPQPNHIPMILYTPGASTNDDIFSDHPRGKPEVCRFMFQFNSVPHGSTISLYACAMNIQHDHRALAHVTDLLTAPAIGSQSENLSNSTAKFPLSYQICLENSKIVLMEHLHHPLSNTIVVQGTGFLASSHTLTDYGAHIPRFHGCLHRIHIHLATVKSQRFLSGQNPCIRVKLAQLNLMPTSSSGQTAPPVQHPMRLQRPSTQFATKIDSTSRFRTDWTNLKHLGRNTSKQLKLILACSTSSIQITLSPFVVRMLRSTLDAVQRQVTDNFRATDPEISGLEEGECYVPTSSTGDDTEEELLLRRQPSGLIRALGVTESVANWISPLVTGVEIHSGFRMLWLSTDTDGIVPLFTVLVKQLSTQWRRTLPWPIGSMLVRGLSINYYNRDLLAWEPFVEPWSCSLEWHKAFADRKTETTTVMFSSSETLNFNLTVPLSVLLRKLLSQDSPMQSRSSEYPDSPSSQSPQAPHIVSSTTETVPISSFEPDCVTGTSLFRLVNQTGSTVWFQVLPIVESDSIVDDKKSLETGNNVKPRTLWHQIRPDTGIVNLPSPDFRQNDADDSSTYPWLLEKPPKLLIQVSGWKPTYPVSVDRLGVFFRTLERDSTVKMTLGEDQLLLEDQIPSFTRLVIEVIRTGSSLQHSIVLRSGLTVTNDLPDGHQLLVGLQLVPQQAVDTPTSSPDVEDVWSTHLASDHSVQHIPLLLVESGRTAAVPLNLVAASSTGLGLLCFRPTLIPRSSGLSVAAVFRQPDGPRYTSYDWAAICLPDTLLTEDSSTAESSFRRGDSASSVAQPIELSKSDAIKYMDWTRLKQPGELIEANLICRTASSQVGLISATLDSGNNIGRTGDNKPVSTGSHGVIGLPVTAIPHRIHRSRSLPPPQYNMGLVIVRDQFPPDPLWIGLPDQSTDRLHPKCLPGHHVTVGPLIRITNLLPCELNYFFEGTAVTGTLRASEDACVHEISPLAVLKFGVHLEGFNKCESLNIPPNTYNQKVLLRLQDTLGRPLELQVQVISRAGSARHLTVSGVIWLINDSGLPLIFAQSSSVSISTAATSQKNRLLANVAAGQYEEHEQARSMCPLLFSFANKNEGFLLRVRIGRGLLSSGSNSEHTQSKSFPAWSPAISLDKRGVDMVQLKVIGSNNNRPDLVYHVGFEVREGHGRHAVTTVVTFRPRYVIENWCGPRVQVAQRGCVQTRLGDSAIVTLDQGCSQAFHWPRDDLDRFLCVRALLNGSTSLSHPATSTEQTCSTWSGGFQIDRPYAFTVMLRLPTSSKLVKTPHSDISNSDGLLNTLLNRLFLRIVILLRAATFHVRIEDANALPPPFRLENMSYVALSYQQVTSTLLTPGNSSVAVTGTPSLRRARQVGHRTHSRSEQQRLSSSDLDGDSLTDIGIENVENDKSWPGGAVLSYLSPQTSTPYALEEPQYAPTMMLHVQGGLSAFYNLEEVGLGKSLIYDNFVYLTVLGPLVDRFTESGAPPADSFSCDFVFDVLPNTHRVVYSSKIPGRRAQLWWLSDAGLVFHEGSSSPLEPGERASGKFQPSRQFVLDVDIQGSSDMSSSTSRGERGPFRIDADTARQFDVAQLIVAPVNKRRKHLQTWRIDQHGLLVNSALYCVQVYRQNLPSSATSGSTLNTDFVGTPILAARPRASATRLISPLITPAVILPLWLRPGSGRLRVYLYLDGVTRVLHVEDEAEPPSLKSLSESSTPAGTGISSSRWGNAVFIDSIASQLTAKPEYLATGNLALSQKTSTISSCDHSQFRVFVSLPLGVGVSVVSMFAEELVYASLFNLRLSFSRAYSLDVFDRVAVQEALEPDSPPAGGLNVAGDVLLGSGTTRTDTTLIGKSNDTVSFEAADLMNNWVEVDSGFQPYTPQDSLSDFVRLDVGYVQINSQFPAASLPILLFTDTSANDSSVSNSRSANSSRRSDDRAFSSQAFRSSTLTITFQREVQQRWMVHLFKTMQININPVVILAEELLLLKLIQFWQHATCVSPVPRDLSLGFSATSDERVHPRPSDSSIAMDKGPLFWFDRFTISAVPLKLSVQTAKKSLTSSNLAGAKRLLPSLMSFTNAEVRLEPLVRAHVLETGSYFIEYLVTHYQLQLRAHAVHIFGSVDFLGNPIGLINDLTSGISGLVELDVGSLIRHVAHGVGDSTAKVAGTVSHLLNAISLDEKHQYERAAILDVRPDPFSLLKPPSLPSRIGRELPVSTSSLANESLSDFGVTQSSELAPALPIQSGEAIASLTAGFRGFMHGLVGGMTSMVTQPYRGMQEDQLKGFVYGVGRGLLGTVTKPLGGLFDLVSGAMTSLSEVTRFSAEGQPRCRIRPRRSGLSDYALFPLTSYRLDEAIAFLQLHNLTLFTSARQTPHSITHCMELEIGEEVCVGEEEDELLQGDQLANETNVHVARPTETLDPVSRIIHTTVDGAWLSHTFHYPECVFHVLPVQETGVVAILTDRAVWCVSDRSLRAWTSSKLDDASDNLPKPSDLVPQHPTFCLTEHATLLFMLPYHRLDRACIRSAYVRSADLTSHPATSVYVVFIGDSGASNQQLRCDNLSWALQLTSLTRETQFRFVQAALCLFRSDSISTRHSNRHGGVPLIQGHPFGLAHAPLQL
ncbi:hypothetical protein P879_00924 [Paragonimus westermani]|uniref:Vacuolar protein sorting-associated protein 13D n=1 Tax=Paragonimus westermani TaxID=34504 RepID=A0A8T0DQ16_9TREM|nr:hypothetical protein P879_00924 [Paragonimus westermani]